MNYFSVQRSFTTTHDSNNGRKFAQTLLNSEDICDFKPNGLTESLNTGRCTIGSLSKLRVFVLKEVTGNVW